MNLKHVKASLKAALPALSSALKAYAASLVFQAIVIVIVTIDDGDEWVRDRDVGNYAFDEVTYVVLSSFVGISYGDLYPIGIASRTMMCLLSMGGCVFQLFLLGLVIQAAIEAAEAEGLIGGGRNISSPGTPPLEKFMQMLPLYLFLVLTLPLRNVA